ncbi:hypothetical protein DFP72DRAFT_1052478 [Ephemerocybe angulata]|uniref:Secreted protein n=1 Tax=Ephemerocybe angulata TaxID=980116 RepID=A0A8H6HD31_9AGAR|nr:hypothetical protein DFP72DRAFT_1052478 [Tulosesus angulatus]
MKVTIPSILLGILSLSTCAFAYLDYNELDARDFTNSLLVERNTVEVPFQHSLRSFLEQAADAYRRALDDHDDLLEARSDSVSPKIILHVNGESTKKELNGPSPKTWTAQDVQKHAMWKTLLSAATCKLHLGSSTMTNPKVLSLVAVKDGQIVILDCHDPNLVVIRLAIKKGTDGAQEKLPLPMVAYKTWDASELVKEVNKENAYKSLGPSCWIFSVPEGSSKPQKITSLQAVPQNGRVVITCK